MKPKDLIKIFKQTNLSPKFEPLRKKGTLDFDFVF